MAGAFEVTSTTQAPYASICYLRCDWPDGSATRASGVVVGINDVLTALHAVYDATRGGWARNVVIVPGTDTLPYLTEPFGEYTDVGSMVGRAANWDLDGDGLLTQQESAGDLALIGLRSPIGLSTGWLPVASVAGDFSATMAGYPAPSYGGTGLMAQTGVFADAQPVGVYDLTAGLGPGASGGPLLYNANGVTSVAGVLSSGTSDQSLSTYAGLFGAGTMQWLQQAIASDDTLLGLSPASAPVVSPTVFMGTSFADSLTGGAGSDVFHGLAGNDTLDGASGIDMAVFSGTRASHTISMLTGGAVQVADTVSARDGIDTLWHVERVQFDDLWVAFDIQGDAGEAYRLYQAAFNRVPDLGGLGFQINALDTGFSLVQIADNFLASPEFQQTYGALNDTQYITRLYENVLKREPEAAGLQFHLDELASGQSRAMVLTHFSESPECQALVIGAIGNGIAYIL
jgi:V8-like Glu-specific endopeptidase